MTTGKITMTNFADRASVKAICVTLNMLMVLLTVVPTIQAAEQLRAMNLQRATAASASASSRALSSKEMGAVVGGASSGKTAQATQSKSAEPQVPVTGVPVQTNSAGGVQSGPSLMSISGYQSPPGPGQGGQAGGSSAVQNIVDGFNVDQFTGTATMRVPLQVPAGRNGMQPNLALVYQSTIKNGWCGMGWDLDAGCIVRLGKNKDIPKYNGNDRFFLVANGSSIELVNYQANEYRAKDEGSFMKIVWNGDAGKLVGNWMVYDKNGTKYTYGLDYSSRTCTLPGDPVGERTYKWHLAQVEDLNGNKIDYYYTRSDSNVNDMYLNHIQYNYTGSDYGCKVWFIRESRPDSVREYSAGVGFIVKNKCRLHEIRTYVRSNSTDYQQLRYSLVYGAIDNTNRSVLSEVKLYGYDDATSTTIASFNYSAYEGRNWQYVGNNGPHQQVTWTFNQSGLRYDYQEGVDICDVNADGYADYVQANYEVQYTPPLPGWTHDNRNVWLNNKNNTWSHNPSWSSTVPAYFLTSYFTNNIPNTYGQKQNGIQLADVDGDLKVDIVEGLDDSYGQHRRVWLNNGNGWYGAGWATPYPFTVRANGDHYSDQGLRMADVNGDGLVDFVQGLIDNNSTFIRSVWLNNGTNGWNYSSTWSQSVPLPFTYWGGLANQRDEGVRLVDVNGDGLPDFIRALMDGNGTFLSEVFLNNGNGWVSSNWHTPYPFLCWQWVDNYGDQGTRLADINNDGLVDFTQSLRDGNGTWLKHVWINNGANGWTQDDSWTANIPVWFTDWHAGTSYMRDEALNALDVNNDGLTDFVRGLNDGASQLCEVWKQTMTAKPYLLTKVTNAIGGTVSISYRPSSECANTTMPFSQFVVKSAIYYDGVQVSDGGTHQYTTNYEFSNGLFDYVKKEFKGFQYCQSTAPNISGTPNVLTKVTFHQSDALKGRQDKVETYRGDTLMTATQNYWTDATVWGGVSHWARLDRQDQGTYYNQANGVVRTVEYLYDTMGNVTYTKDWGNAGFDNSDENYLYTEYICDQTNWLFRPYHAILRDADNSTVLSEQKSYFDTMPYGQMNGKGLKTKTEVWLNKKTYSNPVEVWLNSLSTYDSYGNVLSRTDALGRVTTYNYDANKVFVTSVVNQLGQRDSTTYYWVNGVNEAKGLYGQQATKVDANNVKVNSTTYDVFGRPAREWGPDDSESSPTVRCEYHYWFEYSSSSVSSAVIKITKKNASEEYKDVNIYDGLGRAIQSHKSGAGIEEVHSTLLYNSQGNTWKTSLPYKVQNSYPTQYLYWAPGPNVKWVEQSQDGLDRVIKVKNPDNTYSTVAYAIDNSSVDHATMVTKTDENGKHHHFYYDLKGKLTQVDEHNASSTYTTTYTYDELGNLLRIDPAHGGGADTIRFYYDNLGRKLRSYDIDRGTWTFEYDSLGNMKKQIDARNVTTNIAYDLLDRIVTKLSPAGTTSYYYDTVGTYCQGRLGKVIDPSGSVRFTYNNKGQVINESRKIIGRTNTYNIGRSYNSAEQVTSLTYPDGESVPYTYDTYGQLTSVSTYATNVTYATAGQCSTLTYGNGLAAVYTYNPNRRWLTNIQVGPSGSKLNLFLSYDARGNVTALDNPNTNRFWFYSYDDLYRLVNESCRDGGDILQYRNVYSYDCLGNRQSVTDRNNNVTTYIYDTGNQRYNRLLNDGSRSFNYDAIGNITGDGTNTYAFNADNRLTQSVGGTTTDYLYNSVGLRVKKTVHGELPRDKYVPIKSTEVQSAVGGEELTATATVDKKRLIVKVPTASVGNGKSLYIGIDIDGTIGSGNLFLPDDARTGVEAASAWEYCLYMHDRDNYGLYNRNLATVSDLNGVRVIGEGDKIRLEIPLASLGNPQKVALLAYCEQKGTAPDIEKPGAVSVDKAQSSLLYGATILLVMAGDESTYYLYDNAGHVLCEMNNSGAVATKFYYLNGQMVARKQLTTVSYYHNDHLGSPRAITDASGNVIWQQDYYAFGKDYGTIASGNAYKFNGKPLEDMSLYNYSGRYYDPVIGRFISCDPVLGNNGNPQSLNPYSYCVNNPVCCIDPTGCSWLSWLGSALSIISTFVGMPWVGMIVSAALSAVDNHGGFWQCVGGLAVGLATGWVGGSIASKATNALGMGAASLSTAVTRGAMSGTVSGGLTSAVYKQDIGKGALTGGLIGGALGAGVWVKNVAVTNYFRAHNVNIAASVSSNDKMVMEDVIKEAGQTPVGQRMMIKMMIKGESINILSTTDVASAECNCNNITMCFDVDAIHKSTIDGAWRQLSTQTLAGEFIHELGHAPGLDLLDPTDKNYNTGVDNISRTENLYRAWMGLPEVTGYSAPNNIPSGSLLWSY